MEKVFRHCNEVIFCFDGDTAGRKAADRALDAVLPLMQPGRQAKFLLLEDGDDPDTLVRRIGTEQFLWQVDQAPSLSQFLFSRESEKLDLSRPDDRALLINQVSPKIACIPEGALKSLILKSLSEKTGLSITDINQLQAQTAPKEVVAETEAEQARAPHEEAPKKRAKLSKDERSIKRTPARAASAMLLLRPQILHGSTVELQLSEEEISFDQDLQLLSSLIDAIKKEPDIHTNSIIGRYLAQKQSSITQLLAMDHQVEGDELLGKEFFEAIQQIQSKRSKLQRQQTSASISKSTRIDQLSPEQREQYLALFKRENSH
jgi:DNA primase